MESRIGFTAGPEYGGPERLVPSALRFVFTLRLLGGTKAFI